VSQSRGPKCALLICVCEMSHEDSVKHFLGTEGICGASRTTAGPRCHLKAQVGLRVTHKSTWHHGAGPGQATSSLLPDLCRVPGHPPDMAAISPVSGTLEVQGTLQFRTRPQVRQGEEVLSFN
jgi:hypothetical protein